MQLLQADLYLDMLHLTEHITHLHPWNSAEQA